MDFVQSIKEAESTAMREKAGYPRLAQLLRQAGVRHYIVDTTTGTTTFYGSDEHTSAGAAANTIAPRFSTTQVIAALRAVQAGVSSYEEFLVAIAAAGVQTYLADLEHGRVIYIGHGRRYEEDIPSV